ncbi:GGDEF domain-containing protein [Ferrovibrio sp.]|uniref:GGDEF domain-containing protein n=2 Tax=Ferrovibrio sp. TaxID=1917215 RepID=UPI00311F5505
MIMAGLDTLPLVALVAISIAVCDLLIMMGISMMYPRESGPAWWSMGYMLFAISTLLTTLRSPQTEPLVAVITGAGFVLMYAVLWIGYARFLQLPLPYLPVMATLLGFFAGFAYFLFAQPDVMMRAGLIGIGMALMAGGACYTLLRHMQPALLQSQAFAAILLGIAAILYLLRSLTGFFGLIGKVDLAGGPLGSGILLIPGLGSLLLAVATGMMLAQRQQQRLGYEARTDELTGLISRHLLDEIGMKEISRARRHGYPLCVMILDIDYFHAVNRQYGYRYGDTVLQQLAVLTSRSLRREDFVARLDGASFCILLPSTRLAGAEAQAERLRGQIAASGHSLGRMDIRLTASVGIATLGLHGDDWPTLVQRARDALFRAKTEGRNRIETAPLMAALRG